MLSLGVNSIVSPGESSGLLKKPVRVLGIRDDFVLVIELGTNPSKPWRVERSLLVEEINNGAAVLNLEMVPMHLLRSDDEIGENEKISREKNWGLVRGLVEGQVPLDILTSNFGALVANHALVMGVDRKQIYRLLYRYWSMGQTRNAFLWNTSACGGPGKSKNRASGIVPGRPLKYRGVVVDDGGAILLEARHMGHIRLAYGRVASGRCGSLKRAHEWMLDKFYRSIKSDGSKGNLIRGSYPSIHQLNHHGKLFFDELYRLKTRGGAIRYNKDHRPLVGSASDGLVGAGHRYEIDSTIADVYLVHRVNRLWLIGRPVLYVVVDTFTRMIIGVHVGLEGPSWNGARHAIYNACTAKKDFCKRYNIEIDEGDWPCAHLPVEIVADRAELLSEAGETMTKTLGTVLKILPPFRPDWKSIIESRFRLINEKLDLKFSPGGVDARKMERGDRDYQLDAIFDIDEFTEMVIVGVLAHNKSLRVPHLLSREMIAAEVEPTPIAMWNWSMANNLLNSKVVSPAELKIALLPSQECRIGRGGISFQGVQYTCETAIRSEWLERSHNFKTRYVRVFYDPNSIENCWIKSEAGFEPLTIVPQHRAKYAGLRMEEVLDMIKILNQVSPDARYEDAATGALLHSRQEEILNRAKAKRRAQGNPESDAEFKRDKRSKRATETQNERDLHTADLNQLRLVNNSPDAVEISNPVVEKPASGRSAAFLKLVINADNEANHE
ncbi:Mu transposase C-terminal domain-containing protein [Pseudomonas sp. MAFF 311095]|uniref:Mu transposase C-terminal domain-containing protein n=1 Tax=Pseudomonas petroselini TaxID=2899822 RepID=A0ABS8QU01_9PSED|nr:Mu transposase C-terminal domain-containing protein [Pseudomonas petroselini]MCD7038918.1 Mu transposase C-terminal domain-containing protein [Pseudomonas petroselini]MCD7044578.1 Mu transposase C-terminal domain-containing protein [Pseudomonas petroselini]MCD7067410.1 Mu transposase C-terminal domain-containing protein [Pseudomonas petroselini]MCD7077627.1 Mu transposase C-terminal domain-containing protein [Pseudomonas petroselini]